MLLCALHSTSLSIPGQRGCGFHLVKKSMLIIQAHLRRNPPGHVWLKRSCGILWAELLQVVSRSTDGNVLVPSIKKIVTDFYVLDLDKIHLP
ncbi:rCG28698 [Rattus norvegicus]|uniref:RCG28698 n=1 Tax=Rattus norvegicus TaxID=10116 RepID=A6HVM9_RAT|nr:rCG28698 [Rattus norvegicus]